MVVGVRRHMPRRRSGHTTTVTIGAERFCLTANQRDDGGLGEVFIHWGKHGTSAAGLVSTYAVNGVGEELVKERRVLQPKPGYDDNWHHELLFFSPRPCDSMLRPDAASLHPSDNCRCAILR